MGNLERAVYSCNAGDSGFGCWGDSQDAYFGGRTYAEMLQVVYLQVKSADPESQVLLGGLLLDCNPEQSPEETDCRPARFLESILQAGGGAFFDVVSFHAYDYWQDRTAGHYANPNWQSAWNTTGPVVIAKVNFLRAVLARYEVSKFFMSTESAILCFTCSQAWPDFQATQAAYIAQVYASAIAQGLSANVWYS